MHMLCKGGSRVCVCVCMCVCMCVCVFVYRCVCVCVCVCMSVSTDIVGDEFVCIIQLSKRGSYDRLETLQSIIIITKISIPNLQSRHIHKKPYQTLTIKNPYQTHHQKSIPNSPSKIHTKLTIKNPYQTHHKKTYQIHHQIPYQTHYQKPYQSPH